jgi:peptidoglycan/LPS O-acetylase OafA/YrhL
MTSSAYRADIDGLRAVAVGLVVLQHTGLLFFGGFIGVDVFFVISGFLITRIIQNDLDAGSFSLRGFWIRRIRRIIPAAALMVAATLLAGWIFLQPVPLKALAESALAQELCLSNFYFWTHSGYFDVQAELQPLLHTWSLAVEEQFYLGYPLLLMILGRGSPRTRACALTALAAASLLLSEWLVRSYPSTVFYLMPFRMWELLLGGLLALCPNFLSGFLSRLGVLDSIGLLLILVPSLTYTPLTPFPGFSAVAPCLGAALIIAAPCSRRLSATALLSTRPFRYVGRASYSIYLWHWPILVFTKIFIGQDLRLEQTLGLVLATLLVGALSFEFIETHFRQRRWGVSNFRFAVGCGLSTIGLCLASLASVWFITLKYPWVSPAAAPPMVHLQPMPGDGPAGVALVEEGMMGTLGVEGADPVFVLWGDSHAYSIARLSDSLARSRRISGILCSQGGYVPLVNAWCNTWGEVEPASIETKQLQWSASVMRLIEQRKIRHVILAGRWETKVPSSEIKPGQKGLIRDRLWSPGSPADPRQVFDARLRETIATIEKSGGHLWFLNQPPVQGQAARGVSRQEYERQQREVDRITRAISSPAFSLVGPGSHWFDTDGYSIKADANGLYYRDSDHLNEYGAEKLIRPILEPIFDRFLEK